MSEFNIWLSQKGVNYILHPKRGAWTNINPNVCMTLTAKGQSNWIGSFVSPDIERIERDNVQGGTMPVKIITKNGKEEYYMGEGNPQYRIRKLTPKECWRLMGFSDEDFYKAEEVNSNTQLYKQAGNSIVKNVLMAIFNEMIEEELK